MMHSRYPSLPARHGLTLLEIILALSLMAIIVGMLGTIVGRHTRITDTADRNVAQAELANAILDMIAEDLRGVQIDYEGIVAKDGPIEPPPTEEELAEEALAEEEEAAAAAEEEGEATDTVETELTAEELEALVLPIGLYGGENFIRFDSSMARRNGRRWISNRSTSTNTNPTPLSELRTITYTLDIPSSLDELVGILPPGAPLPTNQSIPVLYRSVRDRSVSDFFAVNLGGDDDELFARPLATEVRSIEFQYLSPIIDAATWETEWDTTVTESLPLAVQITLVMNPHEEDLVNGLALDQNDLTYRRTVQIPNARPVIPEEVQ